MTDSENAAIRLEVINGRVVVAFAFDDVYIPHFATTITSLASSKGREHVHLVLLAGPTLTPGGIKGATQYLTTLGFTHEVVEIDAETIRKLPKNPIFSSIVWYRLLLPELLPQYEKVLSLDVDTLVLQSLLPLFQQDLGRNYLGAVASPDAQGVHARRLELALVNGYFNAGVMLMNLKLMREEEFTSRALQIGHENSARYTFAEQDVLNNIAQYRWLRLHPKWNALSYTWLLRNVPGNLYSSLELASALWSPVVVHFEGGNTVKPWFYRSMHPMRGLYRQFRDRTPWPLHKLEGRTAVSIVLRRLPLKWQYLIPRLKNWLNGRAAL